MGYEDNSGSGGCLSPILTLLLLPYILAFYGYMLLLLLAVAIFEWVKTNFLIILLYLAPIGLLYLVVRSGLFRQGLDWIKRGYKKSQYKVLERKDLEVPQQESSRAFIPSSNLYCYWCTRKLGLKAWEKNGRYVCQECYEKGLS